jgi:tight adherence protein B
VTGLFFRLGILIAIFASVFLISQITIGFFVSRRGEQRAVNRRLDMLRAGIDRDEVSLSLLKNAPPTLRADAGFFEKLEVRFIRMIMMSGVRLASRQVVVGMAIAFCVLTAFILLLAFSAKFRLTLGVVQLVLVISLVMAVGLPLMVLNRFAQQRRKRMEEQFPIALDVFTRSLRAGHPVSSAIFLITEEMDDPIGSEFGIVSDEVAYGADLADALLSMADRWDLEDMRMFVVSVSVQSETGGNLAEILENLSTVIRARASMYMMVRALSSEGRMTGWMLTVLPMLTLLSMFMVNPGFYLDVAQDPIFLIGFPGLMLLYAIGVFAIRRLVDIKV